MTQTELDGLASERGAKGAAVLLRGARRRLCPRGTGTVSSGDPRPAGGNRHVLAANSYCRLLWIDCYCMYVYMCLSTCIYMYIKTIYMFWSHV